MTETRTAPILLVDLDAMIDLDPWRDLATGKRWLEFFGHIPAAKPRYPELLDAIELAKADGCIVNYFSRWPEIAHYLVREWLETNDFPMFMAWHRRGYAAPAELLAQQSTAAAARFKFRRPVLVIHNNAEIAAEARKSHGIAAVPAAQLPATAEGLRRLFTLARPIHNPKKEKVA